MIGRIKEEASCNISSCLPCLATAQRHLGRPQANVPRRKLVFENSTFPSLCSLWSSGAYLLPHPSTVTTASWKSRCPATSCSSRLHQDITAASHLSTKRLVGMTTMSAICTHVEGLPVWLSLQEILAFPGYFFSLHWHPLNQVTEAAAIRTLINPKRCSI